MKKVLSIVLSLAMVLCLMPTMAFAATTASAANAAYSDTEGKACEGAVNVLSALGVVEGYTDGQYKPENVVTRAEMAALIIRALGVSDYATATTSRYSDMANATWAIPVVEYASNLKIIEGYGDGRFGPGDSVTYEQAATMINRALGYTEALNEMNGEWPAIHVQKARALGILDDIEGNVLGTGANRGDIAIMLYNSLELAQVYADNDGATHAKSGPAPVTFEGVAISGLNMMTILNKDGSTTYDVLDQNDADNALLDIRSYVGAAGKIYKNKDGDVISLGDIKSVFLSGTVNSDGDKFTTNDGTVYTVNNDSFSGFVANKDGVGTSVITKDPESVPKFVNGEKNGTYSEGKKGALDDVEQNKGITIAAKVSGKTITNIFSISEWSKASTSAETFLFEESDATQISNKQSLKGHDFITDNNGDIDYSTFTLTGVNSLDDIKEDNVVYVYYDRDDKIRKVEVGTQVVEGTLNAFTKGTKKTEDNVGVQAKFEIGDTTYQGTNANFDSSSSDVDNLEDWTLSGDSETVIVGDDVTAYLDASGKIYQIKPLEAGSSSYAMVLDYDIEGAFKSDRTNNLKDGFEITNGSGLNGDDSLIKVMTASGEVVTLKFKNKATISADPNATLSAGDIITYNLNSSNQIKSLTIKADVKDNGSELTAGSPKDITAKGYYDGRAISDSAVIFTVDKEENDRGTSDTTIPIVYIDEDEADVIKLETLLDTDDVASYTSIIKSGKYTAMVIDGSATSSDIHYGIVTGITQVSNDSINADYRVTVLENGESKTYYVDDGSGLTPVKDTFYAFKLNTQGYISLLDDDSYKTETDGIYKRVNDTKVTYLGYLTADENGVDVKGDVAGDKYTMDSDVVYYNWSASSSEFTIGDRSDLTGAAKDRIALFFDTDKDKDKDGVADVVIIAPANVAEKVTPAYNAPTSPEVGITSEKPVNIPDDGTTPSAISVTLSGTAEAAGTAEVEIDSITETIEIQVGMTYVQLADAISRKIEGNTNFGNMPWTIAAKDGVVTVTNKPDATTAVPEPKVDISLKN